MPWHVVQLALHPSLGTSTTGLGRWALVWRAVASPMATVSLT